MLLSWVVTVAQFHLFTNRNRYSGKIDVSCHMTKQHHSYYLWECILYNFITIIKLKILPSIRVVRDGLLYYPYVCVLICCSNWGTTTTNKHLYKVVNYLNCVNMYMTAFVKKNIFADKAYLPQNTISSIKI